VHIVLFCEQLDKRNLDTDKQLFQEVNVKITALVENLSDGELKPKHGLSFYIQTQQHKLLFDVGPDSTLFENAEKKGVDLSEIDTVVISHGHTDHGGALARFLRINTKAKVYIQRLAFERHTCKLLFLQLNVGIDKKLMNHPQIILLDGDYTIDDELSLFTVMDSDVCKSDANDVLYENGKKDTFQHEQNLLIREKTTALIVGCGHTGIVNIMQKATAFEPAYCIGGYHLYDPIKKKSADERLLNKIADHLSAYPQVQFYTCHCTDQIALDYLASRLPHIRYFSCGNTLELE
jgi:7,8-dihydropterin-6-yl-methyl-4-(beta-D-ribofuranosyl)aminobenzene 5'-phosphate synthase